MGQGRNGIAAAATLNSCPLFVAAATARAASTVPVSKAESRRRRRAVPTQGASGQKPIFKGFMVTGPTSSTISSSPIWLTGTVRCAAPAFEFLGHHHVAGQKDCRAGFIGHMDHLRARLQVVGLMERLADLDACAARKVLAMAPPITSVSTRAPNF